MLKRKLGILFLLGCLILASVPAALCRSPAPTIYVAGDGSGDFNCDGKDDHVQINQALKFVAENPGYTTVHLKGPFTYVIDNTLLIGSDTIFEGDSTAVIKLVDNAGWTTMKPLIKQMSSSGNDNIVIRNFEVNVNHDGNSRISRGKGYYNIIYFIRCSNVKVYNMYMHDGHGDGLRIKNCENIRFYNNRISKLGHDGFYAIDCQNVEAWGNTITCRTNSGLRVANSNQVKFHDNQINSFYHWSAGGSGILIEKTTGVVNDVEVYNNTINNTYGPGMWLIGWSDSYSKEEAQNVHIYHNIFYNTGKNPSIDWVGGIVTSGFYDTLIENNVFDGIYHAAIINMYPTGTHIYPTYEVAPSLSPTGTGYTTIVRNNIIVNTQKRTEDPDGTGYAIINYLPETHNFVLQNNCLYNNYAGKYKNCTSTTDIYADPLFISPGKHDYHLKSVAGRWNGKIWVKDKVSSPCIDAGYSSSDYSNEPEDNGNRINIGRYGNTIYASKSNTSNNYSADEDNITYSVGIYDNRLREGSPTRVLGDNLYLDVGGMSTGRYRDIMWFNLSEYTNATKVSNATLSLVWYYPASSRLNDTIIEVYRPASSWDSSYVSWNKKNRNTDWKNPGGDWYDKKGVLQGSTPYATLNIKASSLPDNTSCALNVTDLVKEYINGKYANTGILIKARSERNNYIAFYGAECENESQVPKLDITYK